jgi:transcription antitermination factor NusG
MRIKGIDISYVQEGMDYAAAAKSGVKFAIIRLGLSNQEDVTAAGHIKGCEEAGIKYGFYWYSYAMGKKDVEKEAKACLETLKKYNRPEYPVFFDIEEKRQIDNLTTDIRTEMVKTFCDIVAEGGYPCGLYVNPSWLEQYLHKDQLVDKYDIWLAHWTGSPETPSEYRYNQKMWQWGLDKINKMDIDGDICFVDYPAITKKWYEEHGFVQEEEKEEVAEKFKAGDKVTVNTGAKAYNGGNLAPWVDDGVVFDVLEANGDRVVIGIDGAVTAAVRDSDLALVEKSTKVEVEVKPVAAYSKGDKVTVKLGATDINGTPLAPWVYSTEFEVIRTDGENITIGLDGKVTAVIAQDSLQRNKNNKNEKNEQVITPNKKSLFHKGDKVKIKKGSSTYEGGNLAFFVYYTVYTVLEEPINDRVVVGLNGNVTAAIKAKDLIKVN